ncbi:hypothetical protein [Zhongshania aquimaris]|uniref:O-antigen ligase domain-containing protein n=1 Tax=Zhongshania aquimaris TaxID=2857107 RepID=A0ABS6VRD3_9GAMM|nr:hypothetical protein [Zhongshania aquimaris]MBW2940876.1 hypothetical protein [Zhongshania aquimaris]
MNMVQLFRHRSVFIVAVALFINSQIFSATTGNPLGIKGLQEIFYVCLVVYTIGHFYTLLKKGKASRWDLFVIAIVLLSWIYSALLSALHFGQPFIYGLIEERRILSFLIYFPVISVLRLGVLSEEGAFNFIIVATIVCVIALVLVAIGIIPSLQEIEVGQSQIRQERYGIGHHYMAIAILYCFYNISKNVNKVNSSFVILICYFALILIVQTRQVILGVSLAAFVIIGKLSQRGLVQVAIVIVLVAIAALVMGTIFPEYIERYKLLMEQTFSDDYLVYSARSMSIRNVFDFVSEGNYLGGGALSPLWQGGFTKIYGEYFFLADIGVFGTIYKFGVFGLLIYLLYFPAQIYLIKTSGDPDKRKLYLAIFLYLLVAFPFAAIIEYRGFISGLLFSLTVFSSEKSKMEKLSWAG